MTGSADVQAAPGPRAIARWKRGHQAFHLLLITMTTVLDEALVVLKRRDWDRLAARFGQLATLYDAATASMRYAADFDPEQYATVVRPSMMPPSMASGFSGTLNREHTAMVAALERLGLALEAVRADTATSVPAAVDSGWSAVQQAQRRNRKHHALICRRFAPEGPSLLQQFYRERANEQPRSTDS
jgi:hypothetical protein